MHLISSHLCTEENKDSKTSVNSVIFYESLKSLTEIVSELKHYKARAWKASVNSVVFYKSLKSITDIVSELKHYKARAWKASANSVVFYESLKSITDIVSELKHYKARIYKIVMLSSLKLPFCSRILNFASLKMNCKMIFSLNLYKKKAWTRIRH